MNLKIHKQQRERDPRVFGMENYINLVEVGAGRYGVVYDATNQLTGASVMIKQFNRNGFFYGMREVEVSRSLPETPSALKIDEFFMSGDILCVVYPIQHGFTSLGRHVALLRRNPPPAATELTVEEIRSIMREFLSSLNEVHKAGIIHRGLTPGNVLVAFNPTRVRLFDFRSGKCLSVLHGLLDEDDASGNFTPPGDILRSTYQYFAPEMLMEAAVYSREVDIWSAGVMFAGLVNGRPLYPSRATANGQLSSMFGVLGLLSINEMARIRGTDGFD